MDKSYEEKLLGKVDEGVYERKMHEWRQEEMRLKAMLEAASSPLTASSVGSARRILELAQNAHSIYLSSSDTERAQLLKSVLSNCSTDGVSLWPTYKKPFDVIFECAKNEEWRRERDSNPRYGSPYSGFQDHPFQPLTHPSAPAVSAVYRVSSAPCSTSMSNCHVWHHSGQLPPAALLPVAPHFFLVYRATYAGTDCAGSSRESFTGAPATMSSGMTPAQVGNE